MSLTEGIAVGGALFTLAGVVLAGGGYLAKLSALGEKVRELERSREAQGTRMGEIEKELVAVKASNEVERDYSRRWLLPPSKPGGGGGEVG